MAQSRYRTVKGKVLDFDKFRALNDREISVGNMGVNARGDQINAHGDIIKTRNEVMKQKYLDPKARYNPVRTRSQQPTVVTNNQPTVVTNNQPTVVTNNQPIQSQSQQQPVNQVAKVEEYVKPGVVDLRHRVLGQSGFDLRGSLANSVSMDLTTPEQPSPQKLTTLRRI